MGHFHGDLLDPKEEEQPMFKNVFIYLPDPTDFDHGDLCKVWM